MKDLGEQIDQKFSLEPFEKQRIRNRNTEFSSKQVNILYNILKIVYNPVNLAITLQQKLKELAKLVCDLDM